MLTLLTKKADGVLLAHTDGDVPNMFITLPEQDAFLHWVTSSTSLKLLSPFQVT